MPLVEGTLPSQVSQPGVEKCEWNPVQIDLLRLKEGSFRVIRWTVCKKEVLLRRSWKMLSEMGNGHPTQSSED